jgi:hypothetical protein
LWGAVFGTIDGMKQPKDTTNHTKQSAKKKYRVRNWKKYNESLVKRGSLTLWIPENVSQIWTEDGRRTYSDASIEMMITLKAMYGLSLRATEGFAQSVFALAGIPLDVPDYTTISRRAEHLSVKLKTVDIKQSVNIILDSTGNKVYGEGEWKVRQHGWSKRRTWTKIHIGIDSDGEIRAEVTTENNIHDSLVVDDILNQEKKPIDGFWGDGAYDASPVYMSLVAHNIPHIHIPPHKNARIRFRAGTLSPPYVRDEHLRAIRKEGRTEWKHSSGYHTRSLVENTMYRYKTAFGERIFLRKKDSQHAEVRVKCNILNTFHFLGMPESFVVT